MIFVIISEDVEGSLPLRLGVRADHLKRLEILQQENRLLLAGPFPLQADPQTGPVGFSGSLIVAEFDSLSACQAWADADPYVTTGVYAKVTIKPFKKVFP